MLNLHLSMIYIDVYIEKYLQKLYMKISRQRDQIYIYY